MSISGGVCVKPQQLEVEEQMGRIVAALTGLAERIATAEERLAPVLVPSLLGEKLVGNGEPLSQHGKELAFLADQAFSLEERVASILARLQI